MSGKSSSKKIKSPGIRRVGDASRARPSDACRRRVLQGTSVGGLPVERPTRFRLVANRKTASALGITLPTSILLSADEAIGDFRFWQ
jgi:hypothetical protein